MTSTSLRPDRLRWIISALLLAPALGASADPLTAASGPGGTPIISTAHGVPVIDIVAPNGHGISHNQFVDFNVGAHGTVLNNSLQAGDSVLAGVLQANAQFQGQAASAIINEVIGMNGSNVLGAQEIFGQRADYILANPNGISVNGATSINIGQMTFLVGTPQLEDGQIKSLSTLHSQGRLEVGGAGLEHHGGTLDLLTPYIETTGAITAPDHDVNLVVGHNRIDPASRLVLETAAVDPTQPAIDAQLLGAMQGGRIRIVSTALGAGVRLPQQIRARHGVEVNSAGSVDASGRGGQRVSRATLDGGEGDVLVHAAQDITLTAVDITGRNLDAQAGNNLRLDPAIARRLEKHRESYNRTALFVPIEEFAKTRDETLTELGGTRMMASGDVTLKAGARIDIAASQVQAGGRLSVSAGDELLVDGRAERSEVDETVRHRKHFWRGDSDRHEVNETLVRSALKGAEVDLQSATTVHVRGSSVHSDGGLRIQAGEKLLVDSVVLKDSTQDRQSRGDALGGIFNNRLQTGARTDTRQQGSQIVANGSQQLVSDGDLTLVGSKATAGELLEVKAKGAVRVSAGLDQSDEQTRDASRGFIADARQTRLAEDDKPASRQYMAGIGYEVGETARDIGRSTHQASALLGKAVKVNSDAAITVVGSSLTASDGNILLNAPEVNLLASVGRETIDTRTRKSGGSLQVGGGIDRLSTAFEGHSNSEAIVRDSTDAKASRIDAAGELRIDTPKLLNEGSQIKAGGPLLGNIGQGENRAAVSSVKETRSHTEWQGTLGASLEYRDLTRPIEKLVLGQEQTRFQQPGVEDALAPPSLGADLDVNYHKRNASTFDSTAQVTRFEARSIDSQVSGTLVDHATEYVATGGKTQIVAGKHDLLAVANVNDSSVHNLRVEGGLRVDSNTGADLNVRLSGTGHSLDRDRHAETAVVGSLEGSRGIALQLGTDGRYEGTKFKGGDVGVDIKAGGSLDFAQANDRQTLDETLIDGTAWAKGGNSPAAGKTLGASAVGQYKQHSSADSQARTVQFDGPGAISAKAGRDLRMDGGRMGTAEVRVASLDLSADGKTELLASVDAHSASGRSYGGGIQPNLAGSTSGQGGGLGGALNYGRVQEHSQTLKGGDFHVGDGMSLSAGSRSEEALRVQGLQSNSGTLALAAPKGGILIDAATSTEQRDNVSAAGGLAMSGKRDEDVSKNARAGFARATLNLDRLDSATHANSQLRADSTLTLDSRLDTRLAGANLQAHAVSGSIGGDLRVDSRQDQVNGLKIDADARLSSEKNPQGLLNGISAFAGPAGAKVKEKVGSKIQLFDTGLTPSVDVTVVKQDRTTVGQASSIKAIDSLQLAVGGDTRLRGAVLKAGKGEVELGGSAVSLETLNGSDYRAEAIVDLSNAPVDIAEGILEAAKRKMSGETSIDLGLIRAGGHNTEQVLRSSID